VTSTIHLPMKSDARGVGALQLLLGDASGADAQLVIDARGVERADAFTGSSLSARIALHLAGDPSATVLMRPPADARAWLRLHDLLGPLPARCAFEPGTLAPSRDRSVIFPAQRLRSMDEAELLGRVALFAARDAGMSSAEAHNVALAILVFGDNAFRHAADSSCGVMVSTAVDQDPRQIKVVAVDCGRAVSDAADPLHTMRDCVDRSRENYGGLSSLGPRASMKGARVSVLLSAGPARARWLGHWRGVEERPYAPGMCAAMIVHA